MSSQSKIFPESMEIIVTTPLVEEYPLRCQLPSHEAKKIALFLEDRVAKKSLTRAAAKKFFLHTNGNPDEKRK